LKKRIKLKVKEDSKNIVAIISNMETHVVTLSQSSETLW